MSTNNNENASATLDEILSRVRQVAHVESDSAVSLALGAGRSSAATWRKRRTVPCSQLLEFANKHALSLDWLFRGLGRQRLTDLAELTYPAAREKPASFGDRLSQLAAASELIMRVTREHALDIDPDKDAAVLEFVYRYNLDADGVLRLLRLLEARANNNNGGSYT